MNKLSGIRSIVACGISLFLIGILTVGNALAKQQLASSNSSHSTTLTSASTSEAIESVNINSADADTLQKVKGIGKKRSQAIADYRNKNGQFKSLEDLLKVKCRGINKKWLDKISKFLTL